MTLSPFMLSFGSETVTRDEIIVFLNTRHEVKNWYAALPSTIFVVSPYSVHYLTKLINDRFGDSLTFVITKINRGENSGYINKAVWDFINKPMSSGRWPDEIPYEYKSP